MKRHRKLVSLIIALAFVLSLALPVGFV
ncbi:MAG: hypothetical protein PWP65_611, partial [Clostridia bacterium]|nr:hypothetical protein [Clostridia bacterium]